MNFYVLLALLFLALHASGQAQLSANNFLRNAPQAVAEERNAAPATADRAREMATRLPDDVTPFYMQENVAAEYEYLIDTQFAPGTAPATYPQSRKSNASAGAYFRNFFRDMFASVRLWNPAAAKTEATLTLDPTEFNLAERREVAAVYRVTNRTRKLQSFEFPTSQRFEMLTRSADGTVIERWSDDRAFTKQDGFLVINPNEKVEYSERIPTRDMKAGETYTVEATLVDQPNYTTTAPLQPR